MKETTMTVTETKTMTYTSDLDVQVEDFTGPEVYTDEAPHYSVSIKAPNGRVYKGRLFQEERDSSAPRRHKEMAMDIQRTAELLNKSAAGQLDEV